ncbi:DUF4142 domain-containing protein [Actinomadura craniellae]|uniref:DUF4142 domain-containing protein n=1 Tax=Actinomadura craniellae TaxID=2231787 RepID=A0A365H295_9ACTN|nr:DUF4142 domain-containing protein [Actinomadura craniellae]RAY13112.1 DUF4142 domain-containing protein [Actinomadura craniellae]
MRRHRTRRLSLIEFLVLGISLVLAGAAAYVIARPSAVPADGQTSLGTSATTQTRWGPLDAADRDLLAAVRRAGLWEAPTGQQAQQRGSSPRVKEIGGHIAAEHLALDKDVRAVAARLDVVLPSRPNRDQETWMAELTRKSGDEYDRAFVYLLRAAHGKVFVTIAKVRSTTRNALVRDFSARANAAVLRHMSYLESTGLVNYSTLK